MEFVEGQNLKQLLRSTRVFEVDAALDIIIEVCKGVGYAHRAGLIHCDLKPQNILVTPERRIKVVDFGIARAYSPDQQAVMEDTVWGSPSYFSPEQARGESPTPASDVYSIGVVLFELLTGRLPFEGEDFHALALAHIQTPPPSILSINSALPQELDKITQTTLSKEPSQRYRTADQLGRILLSYSQQGLERTSSFVVNRSQARMKPVRPEEEVRQAPPPPSARPPIQPRGLRPRIQEPAMNIRPEPPGEPTIPSLPPIDTGPAAGRAASPPPAASYASPPPRVRASQSYGENGYEDPGLDIYGIVLGIFAGLLVMGLIPLWMTVYFTLTR
jgi:serine/threonine protein kinase